jgi:hypothetical protein
MNGPFITGEGSSRIANFFMKELFPEIRSISIESNK